MFRFTTAGESHGRALVAILEGLPAGMPVSVDRINHDLKRRQWGYGRGGRMKIEQGHGRDSERGATRADTWFTFSANHPEQGLGETGLT
jgi:hypothetical protein